MKKSLLALAVLGAFAGAASAQSSVTMYGWLDIGYQYNKQGVNLGGSQGWVQENVSGIDGGYWNGNRFGVRGSEAISPNLNAIFQLEMGFSLDTGVLGNASPATGSLCQNTTTGAVTTSSTSSCPSGTSKISGATTTAPQQRVFGRQAYAGLSGDWGALVAGRIATFSSGTGAFDMFGPVDPFETGWGINSLGQTFISANSLRLDNTVAYVSPVFVGFKAGAAYSFNTDTGETAPSGSNTTAMALGASFSGLGGLYAAITYDVVGYPTATNSSNGTPVAGQGNPDQKHLQIGASYDFKIVKIAGAWADQKNISSLTTGNVGSGLIPIPAAIGNYNNNAWMLGLTVPILGNKFGTVRASYQYSDAKNIIRNGVSWEPDYYVWGLGYSYDLSNRTRLYAGYGQRSYDGNITGVPGLTANNVANYLDRDQFAVGLNHRF